MDKNRDARRGVSRFSRQMKQSGHKLLSGLDGVGEDFVSLEKSKKERLIKKLSVVNKASSSYEDCETGSKMSDRENEFPAQSQSLMSNGAAKRFKLPKKFSEDCNGVDHASIPRKLRSAMKKRNRESISPPLPDSKKLNHTIGGVQSPKKNSLKKSKLNMKQGSLDWSPKQPVGPITKDEEEVVETLYALAGMFPDNDTSNKTKLDSAPSEVKPPALPECRESLKPAFEDSAVIKEDLSSTCPLRTSEATPSSNAESLLKETAKFNSLNVPIIEEKPDPHDNKNFFKKADSCVPQVNLPNTLPSLAKREYNDDKPSCDPVKIHVLPEKSPDSGTLEQSTQKESPLLERKPDLTLGAAATGSQLVQQDVVMDSRKNGLALWPGLSPMMLHGAGFHGPSSESLAKNPAWLDASICVSSPCSFENGSSTGQISKGGTDKRSLKRCTAHVFISHLIQDLQMPERKQKLPLPNQSKPPQDGQKQGILMGINNFERVDKGLNGVISTNNIGSTTAERNSNEDKSAILQHKRLYQDHQQTATASRVHTLQKQSFDFLSLSAGGWVAEASNSFNRAGNNELEQSSNFQVSYLRSLAQHHKFMPLSMSQTRYTSSTYPDQLSTSASTQQVPPYLSSPFLGPPRTSPPVLTKQQVWAAQLAAAQYRPAGTSTAMNQLPSWLNGRQDPTLIPCPHSIIPSSPSSLEVLGPKYAPMAQHQHQHQHQHQPQLVGITSSLPPARVKRPDHHLPSVYEEIEGGFRAVGALPLQLLCNERL